MNTLRKISLSVLALAMSLSMVGVTKVSFAAAPDMSLIKQSGNSAVYYLKGGKRYVFPNSKTYMTWYSDFSGVMTIAQSELESYPLGGNVTYRPGTRLAKITTMNAVYAVGTGRTLHKIVSEADAINLYGPNWAKMVDDIPDAFFTNYITGSDKAAGMYGEGQLVKLANSPKIYYFDGTNYREIASEAAFNANRFNYNYVVTAPSSWTSVSPMGAMISGAESNLTDTTAGSGGVVSTGSGLTVALSSMTPASTTYVRDTGAAHAQALAPFTALNFSASNDGDVIVNTVKLTRSGISTDTDLGTVYLYDGNTMVAEHTSISNKVITFTNSAGLFTVSKGTTRTLMVKADISNANANVSGIVLGVNAASDIVASGATVTGSFPMNGNQMAVNTVADLGYANISSFTTYPATIDPGLLNQELWRFNITANDQDMAVEKIKLTGVGTISTGDLANLKLEVGGVQVSTTAATMNANKEVEFNFATPWVITSGQTKTVVLKGDVLNGTGRTFKFTIRKSADVMVKDNSYGVYVAPMKSGSAFSLVEPTTGSGTSINNGTLTVSVASDSPSGNVASAGTNIPLARFNYKANGEDIKVTAVRVTVNEESSDLNLKNGKLYFNGSQVGSTDTVVTDETAEVYTMTQVIPAGTTGVFEYRADVVNNANGSGLASGQTIVVSLGAGTTDATGQSSLSSIATAAATGRTLTVATGLLTVAKNLSLANFTTTQPTGVKGATGVKVASLIITAGSAEGATVNQIVVGDDAGEATSDFGDNFQNLTLKHNGVAIATTQGTLSGTAGADYTFSLSPAVTIAAGAQYVVDVYADILTGAAGFAATGQPGLEFVNLSATSLVTSTDAYPTPTVADLQEDVIVAGGSLTITADSATPIAAQVVMGANDQELARYKFAAGTSEDVNVNRIEISDSSTNSNNLNNVSLWDVTSGTPVQVGSTISAFDSSDNATFNLSTPWVITKGQNKTLVVKAGVNAFPNATSNEAVTLEISSNADVDSIGAASGTAITETVTSATGTAQTVVKTKLSITKASDSPSGASTGSTQQTVAKFNVTNSANVGNYDATLKSLTVDLSSTISLTDNTVTYVTFYKDSVSGTAPNHGNSGVGSGNALASIGEVTGTGTCTSAGQLTCITTSPNLKFTNTAITNARFTDVVIAAGSTRTIIVVANTSDAATGKNFAAGIASNGAIWDDGVTSTLTTVDSLPIAGSTLTY